MCVCVCVCIIYNFSLMSKMLDAVEAVHGGVVPGSREPKIKITVYIIIPESLL